MKIKFSLNEITICTGLGCVVGFMLLIIVVMYRMSNFRVHESFHNPADPATINYKAKFIEQLGQRIEKELSGISLNENEAVNIVDCKSTFLDNLNENVVVDDLFKLGIAYRDMKKSFVSRAIERITKCANKPITQSDVAQPPATTQSSEYDDV